jgi:hypothetical protein
MVPSSSVFPSLHLDPLLNDLTLKKLEECGIIGGGDQGCNK